MDYLANFTLSKTGFVGAVFIILFILERLFPVAKWLGGPARVVKNLALSLFNFIASPLIVIPITAFAASHVLEWRPAIWSGWQGLALDLLLLDLWITGGTASITSCRFSGVSMKCIIWTKRWTQRRLCGFISVRWYCRRWCGRW